MATISGGSSRSTVSAPSPALEPHEWDCDQGCPEHDGRVAKEAPGHDGSAYDEEADERSDEAVREFDDGVAVTRRHEAPVAGRPVGAAEPGARGAHVDTDRDQRERGSAGDECDVARGSH